MSDEVSGKVLEVTFREFVANQKLFNRYTLTKILGRGGMGVVWLARDDELERDVALKFLPELIIHDRAVLSDLKHETRRSLELSGISVPGRPGFVKSPYALSKGLVDVRRYRKGVAVKCPFTGKIFITP